MSGGMQRNLKCRYCNDAHYATRDALYTHEKQCYERKVAMDKFIRENPEKANKLKLVK